MNQPLSTAMPALTVFMLVKTRPEWLALAAAERERMLREHVQPIVARHREHVSLRVFDIEFYSARVTDLRMWETTRHQEYEQVVESLRDTPFWDRYFDVVDILPGVENVYGRERRDEAATA